MLSTCVPPQGHKSIPSISTTLNFFTELGILSKKLVCLIFSWDFIFSLSRTVTDKQSNKGRIFIAKNRNGPDGLVFPCFVDWSDVTIKVLNREDNDIGMPSTTDALSVLRQKYNELSAK